MPTFNHGLCKDNLQKARNQYSIHTSNCNEKLDVAGNPVEMRMSFDDWLQFWIESGKYHLRGKHKGCYVMARKGDLGHYEVGNVEIISHAENVKFAKAGEKNHNFGKTVEHGSFKGTTVATNIVTGEQIFMNGGKAIVAAGFNQGSAYQCILGKLKTHLGHRFHRIGQEKDLQSRKE